MHIEIAGAGFGGLAAAAAFARRGCSVRVHERASSLRAFGAGIFVWENGVQALERLDAARDAIDGAHRAQLRETRDRHDRIVNTLVWDSSWKQRTYAVVRGRVIQALARAAEAAGAEIVLNSEVVSAAPEGVVTFANGNSARADLVVLADGANSRAVDGLGLISERRMLRDGAVRVLLPRSAADRTFDGEGKVVEWWSGSRRIFCCPCNDQDLYLAMIALDRDNRAKSLPVDKAYWQNHFPHLGDLFARIPSSAKSARWDRFQVTYLHRWSRGRVAIIGDAAHAMPPNLGQGACLAMVNAVTLADRASNALDLRTALEGWEKAERPITQQTQRISTFYGLMAEWPEPLRNSALWMAGKSRWLMNQRLKAANRPLYR